MKRLKYMCPFGGKQYPYYAALGAFFIGMTLAARYSSSSLLYLFAFGLPLLALVVCFFIEHRLTDGEMQIMEETSYPLWNPVPPELRAIVAERNRSIPVKLLMICILAVLFVMPVSFMSSDGEHIPLPPLIVAGAVIGTAILVDYLRRSAWMNMDDSAVFTLVPIDHMYDVEHRSKHSVTIVSYMVFYLPDGRYVLPVKHGEGETDTLAIFKYRGFVTWLPFHS